MQSVCPSIPGPAHVFLQPPQSWRMDTWGLWRADGRGAMTRGRLLQL